MISVIEAPEAQGGTKGIIPLAGVPLALTSGL